MKSILTLVLFSCAALTIAGCSKEDSTNSSVESGIQCLNTAQTAADADACQAKVAGIQTAQAYLVRCSANLIAQGLTGARLSTAFQNLKSTSTSASATLLGYFVFAQSLPLDTAALTLTNCNSSGVQGLMGLANLIQMATTVANLSAAVAANGGNIAGSSLDPSSPTYDPTALKTTIQALNTANDPTTNATIGTLAQGAQAQYCGAGSAIATQDICTKLNSAITAGNGSTANIGKSLLSTLSQ